MTDPIRSALIELVRALEEDGGFTEEQAAQFERDNPGEPLGQPQTALRQAREALRDHNWTGWPGAVCMACGIEDQREICLAVNCPNALACAVDGKQMPNPDCVAAEHRLRACPEHTNPPCR